MVLPICPQNINVPSSNATASTSSNLYRKLHTALPLIFIISDLSPLDQKKTDEEPIGEFLWWIVCRHIDIKDFLPKQASFCEYTCEIVSYIVITAKERLGPNIWPETPIQNTVTKNIIFTI